MTVDWGPPRRRGRLGLTIAVVIATAILVGLGVWQLQRLQWKTALLDRIAALQGAPAEPLEVVLRRVPDKVDVDYVRVQAACPALETLPTLRLYSVREGVLGYRLIAACPVENTPYRSILVDRGFIPREVVDAPPTPTPLARPIVGVLRSPDKASVFAAKNKPETNDWYTRDIEAMADALEAPDPAPIFLMLERPAPTGPGPQPSPLPLSIPNRHLEYALTWFGLALTLLAVYIGMLVRDRKA
jgi:surfeit locus 1 family protein